MTENTFKVGDRVRVTLELSERYGQTGVIVNRTQVYRRPIFTYEVEFETENPKGWNKDSFMTHELEPAPATHRFPVGAVVVLTSPSPVKDIPQRVVTVKEHRDSGKYLVTWQGLTEEARYLAREEWLEAL